MLMLSYQIQTRNRIQRIAEGLPRRHARLSFTEMHTAATSTKQVILFPRFPGMFTTLLHLSLPTKKTLFLSVSSSCLPSALLSSSGDNAVLHRSKFRFVFLYTEKTGLFKGLIIRRGSSTATRRRAKLEATAAQ